MPKQPNWHMPNMFHGTINNPYTGGKPPGMNMWQNFGKPPGMQGAGA